MTDGNKIHLYNTLTREVEEFKPLVPGQVGVYCCGPTVYDYQHIGNFKTFIFEDLLVRMLRFAGYEVKHVMNITDVGHLTSDEDEGEDKMTVAMKREKKKSAEIADFYTSHFFEDWDKLNCIRPNVVCKATEHIDAMIELIKRIEERGLAYQQGGNVYFDIMKFRNYGKLAKLDLKKLKAGARVIVDHNKRHPHDFALWFTKSKFENQELVWDSPWGAGYPGWHIECSAMSMHYLGEQFDIHCGGIDHVPVHHTNEIAQSEAATGKQWVRVWMHSEFLLLDNEKMSKSKGGFLTLSDVVEQGFTPESYRMLVLSAHYRAHLNFSRQAMESATRNVEKLRTAVENLRETGGEILAEQSATMESYLHSFSAAVFNDLNMPQALAVLWKFLGDGQLSSSEKLTLLSIVDQVFGLGVEKWLWQKEEIPAEVEELARLRQEARAQKNWAAADEFRNQIAGLGYKVIDSAEGAKIKKA